MSFNVHVNDPAYPPGTKLTVAGIAAEFVNGESTTVEDNQVDSNLVADAAALLGSVAGFSLTPPVGALEPPNPLVSFDTKQTNVEQTPQEGGDSQ